jgi:hypothetical protein
MQRLFCLAMLTLASLGCGGDDRKAIPPDKVYKTPTAADENEGTSNKGKATNSQNAAEPK